MIKQPNNNYEKKRSNALKWGYLFVLGAFILFIIFLARILILQNTNVQEFEDNYISKNYREATLKAARGNLFASDGSILATTVMRYDIYLDFKSMRDTIYSNNVGALTDSLSKMFDKPRSYFRAKLDAQNQKIEHVDKLKEEKEEYKSRNAFAQSRLIKIRMESELGKEMVQDSLVSLDSHPMKLLIKVDSIDDKAAQ